LLAPVFGNPVQLGDTKHTRAFLGEGATRLTISYKRKGEFLVGQPLKTTHIWTTLVTNLALLQSCHESGKTKR